MVASLFVPSGQPLRAAPCAETSGNNVTFSVSCELAAGTYNFTGDLIIPLNVAVTFQATAPINLGTANVLVNGGGQFIQSGTSLITIGGNFAIAGTLTHTANTNARTNVVNIQAASIDIQGPSNVNVTGRGYSQANGPGTSTIATVGAGYGGDGIATLTTAQAYGSVSNPTDLGSGGESGGNSEGGGSLRLVATGSMNISGNVLANGEDLGSTAGSGGSGGSIYLEASTLTGSGALRAVGANNSLAGGAGAGGRIAIFAGSSTYNGSIGAWGGISVGNIINSGGAGTIYRNIGFQTYADLIINNNSNGATVQGGTRPLTASEMYERIDIQGNAKYTVPSGRTVAVRAGGIFASTGQSELTVNSGGTFNFGNAAETLTQLTLTANGAVGGTTDFTLGSAGRIRWGTGTFSAGLQNLTVQSGGTFEFANLSTLNVANTVLVQSGGAITHSQNTTSQLYAVSVNAGTITIDSGANMSLNLLGCNNFGCSGQGGTGTGSGGAGGGGHGGNGGDGVTSGFGAGGPSVGSVTQPVNVGARGGSSNFGVATSGGGAIKLVASGTLTVNAPISVNGGNGSGQETAGSAGGSIWLAADTITGTGSLSANGGTGAPSGGRGGGGGGGRIALHYNNLSLSGTRQAFGGSAGTGVKGGAGTIYLKQNSAPNGDLYVINNSHVGAYTTQVVTTSQTFDNMTLSLGASYLVPTGFTTTIASGGTLTTSGNGTTTQPSLTVNTIGQFNFPDSTYNQTQLDIYNFSNNGIGVLTDLTMSTARFVHGGSFAAGLQNLTVGSSGTFEFRTTSNLTVGTSVTVNSGGLITHTNNVSSHIYAANLTSPTITVNSGGQINVNGAGYDDQTQIGGGGNGTLTRGGGGGGHGGAGGSGGGAGGGVNGTPGATHGNPAAPTDLGSRGGSANVGSGGRGGGATKLVASTALVNNGTITANGNNNAGQDGGAGSGGSIWLDVGALSGNGTITSNGGITTGNGGCGGSGLIAIYYITNAFSGTTQSDPGTGGSCPGITAGSPATPVVSANNPVPVITTISPTTKLAGEGAFTLTVNGSGFVTGQSVVRWNGSNRTTTFVSSGQLTASISASDIATPGDRTVTVFNPTPGGGTSNGVILSVSNPVPAITTLVPSSRDAGTAAFTLTVNGSGFVTGQSVVRWNGSDRTTTFVSGTQLTASITAADILNPGTATVTVFNPTPGGGTSNGSTFSITNPLPTTTSISPNSKMIGDAQFTMTVNGTNFRSNSVVRLDGNDRTTTFVSVTQLTAVIPASDMLTASAHSITVFTPTPGGGTSNSQAFTVNNPSPTATSLSPDTVTVGGGDFTLTVNGTNFVSGSVVRVDGADRATTFVSATQVTATVLAADIATTGARVITVFNGTPGGGESGSLGLSVVNPVPTVTTLSPDTVTVGGGDFTLTVNGTNFVSGSVVRVDGNDRTTTFISSTQVTATVLSADIASTGTRVITVFNGLPGGGESGSANLSVVNPAPVTVSLSPSSATEGDTGFDMTVNGSSFLPNSVVRWQGADLTTTYVSATQLTAAVPTGNLASAGGFSVTVFNAGPGGGTSNAQTFTVTAFSANDPTTTSLSPDSALVGSGAFTLTVNGTEFDGTSVVQWNGSPRATTFISATQLEAAILTADVDEAGPFSVTVTKTGFNESNAQTFTVNNPAPVIDTLAPSSAVVGTGQFTLTVNGSNFVTGSVVRWAGNDRATSFVSGSQLTATILAADISSLGTFAVTVFSPAPGGGLSNSVDFTVGNPSPTAATLTPDNTLAGGAGFTLTVDGSSFLPTSVVRWAGNDRSTSFVNAGQLTASILAGDIATAGLFAITVFNPGPGGGSSAPLSFTVNNPEPVIVALAPSSVIAGDPGFTLTVDGTGFVAGSVIRFDGADRATTFVNATQVTTSVLSAEIATAGSISVTVFNPTPGGGESDPATLSINNPLPVTTAILPVSTPAGSPAFTLIVNGSGFVADSVVRFGGSARTTTFLTDTQLSVDIPATDVDDGGSFSVDVMNPAPGGGVSNAQSFDVINPAPTITTVVPASAFTGGGDQTVTITGTNFVPGSVGQLNGNARTTTYVSGTQLEMTVLAADIAGPGSHTVTVFNGGPGGGTSNGEGFTVENPVPVTTSLSPSQLETGTADTVVTVNGSGFISGSVVRFDTANRATTYVSSSQLSFTVAAAEMAVTGTHDVDVVNGGPGGGTSNAQTFSVTNPTPTLTSLDDTSAPRNSPAFTLGLTGANFLSGQSVVRWDGGDRVTTFISSTELQASILAGDLDDTGSFPVTVFTAGPGGGTSNAISFQVFSSGGGGSGGGGTPAAPLPPTAGTGYALSPTVIRWPFTDNANNEQGFEIISQSDGGAAVATTRPAGATDLTYLDETVSTPGGTYCNRAVVAYNTGGNSVVTASQMFNCVTTPLAGEPVPPPPEEPPAPPEPTPTPSGPAITVTGETANSVLLRISAEYRAGAAGKQAVLREIGSGMYVCPAGVSVALTPSSGLLSWIATPKAAPGVVQRSGSDAGQHLPAVTSRLLAGEQLYQLSSAPCYADAGAMAADIEVVGLSASTDYTFALYERAGAGEPEVFVSDADARTDGTVISFTLSKTYMDQVTEDGNVILRYRLIMQHTGDATAHDVVLEDMIPSGTEYHPGSMTDGGSPLTDIADADAAFYDAALREARWTWPVFAPGTTHTVTLRIVHAGPITQSVVNTARATCSDSQCAVWGCGDGVRQTNEVCDAGASNGSGDGVCNAMCSGVQGAPAPVVSPPPAPAAPPASSEDDGGSAASSGSASSGSTGSSGGGSSGGSSSAVGGTGSGSDDGSADGSAGAGAETPADDGSGAEAPADGAGDGTGETPTETPAETPAEGSETPDETETPGTPAESEEEPAPAILPPGPLLPDAVIGWLAEEEQGANVNVEPEVAGATDSSDSQGSGGASSEQSPLVLTPGNTSSSEPQSTSDTTPTFTGFASPGSSVLLYVDGQRVAAVEARDSGSYTYTAERELSEGPHRVEAVILPPEIKEIPKQAAIGTAVLTGANVVGAAGIANVIGYVFLAFTQPTLLFGRKKRRPYGVVFNSLTRMPVDLATVRLRDSEGRILQTKITDVRGRYNFFAKAGSYHVSVDKPGFVHPTSVMAGKVTDVEYTDLLTGPDLLMATDGLVVKSLPVDPEDSRQTPTSIRFKQVLRHLHHLIAASSTVVAFGAFLFSPAKLTFIILLLQLAIYGVFLALMRRARPKAMGSITDAVGGKMKGAVVRIFEAQYNKLLEMQSTDRRGRYAFLVGKGRYYVTATKDGYATVTSEVIDTTGEDSTRVVAPNLTLQTEKPAP